MKTLGAIVCILSFVFWLAQTWYFGWNATPMSPAERLCDTIAVDVARFGIIVFVMGWASNIDKRLTALERKTP